MAQVVSTSELKDKIDRGEAYHLIDVLAPESYEARHLPTAANVPYGPDFVSKINELGISKDSEIIVYCTSPSCGASPAAEAALEKAGFTNVAHYKGGLTGWQEAGYEFEANN